MSWLTNWMKLPAGKTAIIDRDEDTELRIGSAGDALIADYNLQVLLGNVAGHSMVSVIGEIETLTTTRITLSPALTTTDIDQSGLHATSATVDIASSNANDTSAGTGLRTMLLIGLDDNGDAQTEVMSLNGQTEVTSTKLYSAIQGFRGLTAGSLNKSQGDIYVGNGTFTAGVPDTIYFTGETGHNKGLTAYYTVATGTRAVLRSFGFSMVGSNKEAKIHVETSADGIFWITEREFGLESGNNVNGLIRSVPPITAGNHFRLTGLALGATSELAIILDVEIVEV